MSDFYDERPIKATRKDHQCFECQAIIPAGSACTAWSGVYMGDFNSGHFHTDCGEASAHYRSELRLNGEEWFGLREDWCVQGDYERNAMRELLADWPDVILRVFDPPAQAENETKG